MPGKYDKGFVKGIGLRPVSMCAYALRVRVREKMAFYLSSLAVSMCA